MKKKFIALSTLAALAPQMAFAATITNFQDFITWLDSLIKTLLPLIIALAVLVFVWGVFRYIAAGDDEEARKSGRALMINGVIAIFVMVSIWGLVNFLDKTFNLDDTELPPPATPMIPPLP